MKSNFLIFGDCAEQVRMTIQPDEAKGAPYIGLEHIEQGTLHLIGFGSASDVTSAKSLFKKGDILFGKLRPYFRKVVRAPFDGVCSTDIWVVRATDDVDQCFLYYWMASQDFVNFSMQGSEGTKMPRAKWEHISRHQIPFFSPSEQRAIAHILGSLDDKIELNRHMNETLEGMAQALFNSWFVDFDPVIDNALAAGNPIPEELQARAALRESLGDARKPLPEEVRTLFPNEFVFTEEMGWIPKGWEVGVLEDIVVLQRGFDLPKASRTDGACPLITASGQDGTHNDAKVTGPGVVTGRSGKLGVVLFVHEDFWPLNTTLWVKEYKNSSPYHAYFLLNTLGFERFNAGSAVPTLNRNHIHGMKLVVPPKPIVKEFSKYAQSVFDKRFANLQQSKDIAKVRDTLLPKLLSGEIRIPEAEQLVEAV